MPRRWSVILAIVVVSVVAALMLANVQLQYRYVAPRKSEFNLLFKYGVAAMNELDTFNNTYTKDLVMNPPITTGLYLSDEEIGRIAQKMVDIDFFNYPESFPPSTERFLTPSTEYYLKVQNGTMVKEVSWNSNSQLTGSLEDGLLQLVNCITDIVEQRPEYKALPPPMGGYC